MSSGGSDENFAARWSRLKRETAKTETAKGKSGDSAAPPKPEDELPGRNDSGHFQASLPSPEAAEEAPFDPATLPPIDSIVAGTDIRDFLQSGVPAELTKAALRKAWLADPAIRNFIEMAENQWDFTDPSSIPGFGPMRADDNIGELVKQAMGRLAEAIEPAPSSADIQPRVGTPVSVTAQASGISDKTGDGPAPVVSVKESADIEIAATQHVDLPLTSELSNRRGHGRALPK